MIDFDADAVHDSLLEQAEIWRDILEARIRAKLSGDVLKVRSGALLNSITTTVEDDGEAVGITAESIGVPYAGILEYGGKTAAHEILAVKGKALAFVAGGKQIFAKVVHHPGSRIKAYAYLASSLEETSAEMEASIEDAIAAVLDSE
jgi:phage gpG-like protein